MILIKNAEIYAPAALGKQDVLTGGGKILAIEEKLSAGTLPGDVEVIDAAGTAVIPGFVDGHQHFTGGGGEGGFHTRTPEMQLSMNTANGVTTAVGLLGTDSLTRNVESLYAKTESFNAEGITALMLTGSYRYPSPSITGRPDRDLIYIRPVIGVKLALADTRGPHMEIRDLAVLAADMRVAGLISNKPGIITIHVGDQKECLDLVFAVIKNCSARAEMFVPTHINRKGKKIMDQALALAKLGATIDATCMNVTPSEDTLQSAADMAVIADDNGLFEKIAFSSDAGGSVPTWNADKSDIIGMGVGSPDSLLFELTCLVNNKRMPLEQALLPLTTTPAALYGLKGAKGEISVGADADLIVLERDEMRIRDVMARGAVMVRNQHIIKKGYFE
ncbi:MAG: beta-aspartyl-peptidase [Deltaproteobacteria bacterium]|nr:beta-aspartyl-peptidase [Deltaproteobacteria bacterium]